MATEPTRSVSVAAAKADLSGLLNAVESGETLAITRRGRPVAILNPVCTRPSPVDLTCARGPAAGIRAGDALHLAVADRLEAALCTFDRMARAAAALGIVVLGEP